MGLKVCSCDIQGKRGRGGRADEVFLCFVIVWVCVGALALVDRLEEVDRELTGWWLSERQLANGGLNGRPEKLEDVSLV
jgi:hypothetical protein